jgi:hypothetical protein
MNGNERNLFNVRFEALSGGPLIAYVRPGRLALRRKRAIWIARAIAVARRRELRKQMKEKQHGKLGRSSRNS